jgi:hypothetical protein
MPKVTRKETRAEAAQPLQEAATTSGMEIEAGSEQLPPKPSFGALSAQEQAGNKVEFRRVSGGPRAAGGSDVGRALVCRPTAFNHAAAPTRGLAVQGNRDGMRPRAPLRRLGRRCAGVGVRAHHPAPRPPPPPPAARSPCRSTA